MTSPAGRAIADDELDLVTGCRPWEPLTFVDTDRYRREAGLRQYRPEWSWVHEQDGRVLARALWWGRPEHRAPVSLDCLWAAPEVGDPAALVGALLRSAADAGLDQVPEAILDLAGDWRDDPAAVRAVEWRQRAAAAIGLTHGTERVSLEWSTAAPLPARSTRLRFHPADDAAFLAGFTRVAQGSLDEQTRRTLAELGPAGQAEDDLDFYTGLPGQRSAWRIATDLAGTEVGLIIPSRSAYAASVSYLGVYPEHRGHGYGHDLLAEITHRHRADGAERITGTTDLDNRPMLRAFLAGGYHATGSRLVLTR